MSIKHSDTKPDHESLVDDATKGISLLLGILLIIMLCGIIESIKMLFTGYRASLIELITFMLISAEAGILLIAVRGKKEQQPGFLQYVSVWILGLIPYFGWLAVYFIGNRITNAINQHGGVVPTIAILLFIGTMVLCVYIYIFSIPAPVTITPVSP